MDAFGKPHFVPIRTGEDPYHLYRRLSHNHSHSFLFESLTGPNEMAETSVMGFGPSTIVRGYEDHVRIITPEGAKTIPAEDPLGTLRDMMKATTYDMHRYVGGAVGKVNYDAVRLTEHIPRSHYVPEPLFEFGLYDDGILVDPRTGDKHYFWYDTDRSHLLDADEPGQDPFRSTEPTSEMDAERFAAMVERAKEYIYDGDIFQAVLSRRFSFKVSGDPTVLYSRLRRMNPSPYMFHLKQGPRTAIGASPEMLVRITGSLAETFPIAGTRRVADSAQETQRLAEEMTHDEKERAEHTMLVDLGRNDIGRVCRYGTVQPRSLMEVKRFSHVQHMVTHVAGELNPKHDMFDAFRAVFPAGTVSGAPKVRAMEIIDELEPSSRGPYAGAVGYFSYNGCCDFAIAIRSIFIDGDRGFVQSGAGIVYDSTPSREFAETEEKAGAMLQAVRGTKK